MRRSEPLSIKEIMDKMAAATGLGPQLERRSVESIWPQVAGKHIAAYTRRVQLVDKQLHIYITSAALKEELGYLRDTLVKQINSAAGRRAIDNIIIH